MRKNIRKVIDKSYDVYKSEDYILNADNLNPLRDMDFDTKYEEILSAIQGRIEKQYMLAGEELVDKPENLTSEALNTEIDDLLNLFNKNPLQKFKDDGIPVEFLADPNSASAEVLTNMPLQIDCNGIVTLSEGSSSTNENGNGEGEGEEGSGSSAGISVKIIYTPLVKEGGEYKVSADLPGGWNPNSSIISIKNKSVLNIKPCEKVGDFIFQAWALDDKGNITLPLSGQYNKVTVAGKLDNELGEYVFKVYALFVKDDGEKVRIKINYLSSTNSTYKDDMGKWVNNNSTEFLEGERFSLMNLINNGSNKKFVGWNSSADCSKPIIKSIEPIISGTPDDDKGIFIAEEVNGEYQINLYAKFSDIEEDSADNYSPQVNSMTKGKKFDIDGCDFVELSFLKVILAIVTIVKLLVNIVSTILGIIIPIINIVKEAQLAWINPPLMMSIIQRVAQKLMAIIFSLIGTILMKLWQLLNFDCISANSANIIAQIGSILSGLEAGAGEIKALALQAENVDSAIEDLKKVQSQIDELKAKMKEQGEKQKGFFGQVWDAMKEDASNAWEDEIKEPISKTFSKDALNSPMLPDGIKSDVSKTIKAAQAGLKDWQNFADEMSNLSELSRESASKSEVKTNSPAGQIEENT